jgi:hypothetical protein
MLLPAFVSLSRFLAGEGRGEGAWLSPACGEITEGEQAVKAFSQRAKE